MKITFLGAAGEVTGSMFLIQTASGNLLIECGLYQGRRKESEAKNRQWPIDPRQIDAVILSHAHLDHSGRLPVMVRGGYRKKIYMTEATKDLLPIMLRDAAHIQEADLKYINKKHREKGLPIKEPLFSARDVEQCLESFQGVAYGESFHPLSGVEAVFRDAGHILGSAMVELTLNEDGRKVKIVFSGDLGRKNMPILRDPYQPRQADVLIMESTYGSRLHGDLTGTARELQEQVAQTYARGGKVIIPSFSVGRTQEIVYELHKMFNSGTLPPLPIYVDSPLSAQATDVFKKHMDCWDDEAKEMYLRERDRDIFGFGRLAYIGSAEESKKLNDLDRPVIIISASGMCEGGRVLHHLAHTVEDPRNTILIVGFQAQGTLGRKLVEKWERIRILGEEYSLRAQVKTLNGFSAHADQEELLGFVAGFAAAPAAIYLVHGEPDQAQGLAEKLKDRGYTVKVPARGQEATIA